MKHLLWILAGLATGAMAASAQCRVNFSNWPGDYPDQIDRRIYVDCATRTLVTNSTWSVQLYEYAGSSFIAVSPHQAFFGPDLPGIWESTAVTLMASPGTPTTLQVRFYDGDGQWLAASDPFAFTCGSGLGAGLMINFRSNCPEPPQPAQLECQRYAGLTIRGDVGRVYRIEYAATPESTNFLTLTNLLLPASPFLFIDQASASDRQRFYRAVGITSPQ